MRGASAPLITYMSFTIKVESHEEALALAEEVQKRDAEQVTPAEMALIQAHDQANFMEWDRRLWDRNGYSIAFNHLMSERQKQFGYMPGVNSGNGQFESRMPLELFLALGATRYRDDPEWWKDDAKFYKYLREHPEHDGRLGKNNSRGEKFFSEGPAVSLV